MEIRAVGTSGNAHKINASIVAYNAIWEAMGEAAAAKEMVEFAHAITILTFFNLPILLSDELESDTVEVCDSEDLVLISITGITELLAVPGVNDRSEETTAR